MSPKRKVKSPELSFIEKQFEELAQLWECETAFLSSSTQITEHPAYRGIVALGPEVIPLVLRRLSKNCWVGWSHLMEVLTGESLKVPDGEQGLLPKQQERWVNWAKKNSINF